MKVRQFFISSFRFFTRLFTKEQKQFVYVALGDSTVEGLGATKPDRAYASLIFAAIRQAKKNGQFHNLGQSGATVKDVLTTQLDKAIALQPDLVTISVGANDILKKTPLSQFNAQLQTILDTLKTQTKAEIVINNVPDLSLTPRVPFHLKHVSKFLVWRLNKRIAFYATRAHVILVDLYIHTAVYFKRYPELVSQDGFHPSDFGYAIWANIILSHIRHILSSSNTAHFAS